jgi:hypothetical protein
MVLIRNYGAMEMEMEVPPPTSDFVLLRPDRDGTVIDAAGLRRGDELHVDGTQWPIAEVADEGNEVALTIARRSCGAQGTYRKRVRREQLFVAITRCGRRHVYRYEPPGGRS